MKFCPKCHKFYEADKKFCNVCGETLVETDETTRSSGEEVVVLPAADYTGPSLKVEFASDSDNGRTNTQIITEGNILHIKQGKRLSLAADKEMDINVNDISHLIVRYNFNNSCIMYALISIIVAMAHPWALLGLIICYFTRKTRNLYIKHNQGELIIRGEIGKGQDLDKLIDYIRAHHDGALVYEERK